MRDAIVATGLAGVGAVGLGALVLTIFQTALLDFTGLLAAGVWSRRWACSCYQPSAAR